MRLLLAQHFTHRTRGWLIVLSSSPLGIAGLRCQQPAVSLEPELRSVEQTTLAIGREMVFLDRTVYVGHEEPLLFLMAHLYSWDLLGLFTPVPSFSFHGSH